MTIIKTTFCLLYGADDATDDDPRLYSFPESGVKEGIIDIHDTPGHGAGFILTFLSGQQRNRVVERCIKF